MLSGNTGEAVKKMQGGAVASCRFLVSVSGIGANGREDWVFPLWELLFTFI
jgi:hypothetical protein